MEASIESKYLFVGMSFSSFLHVLIVCSIFLNIFSSHNRTEDVVYSVSLEASALKGGIEQMPDPKSKAQTVAPPKPTVAEEKKVEPVKKESSPEVVLKDEVKEKKVEKEPVKKEVIQKPAEVKKVETKEPEKKIETKPAQSVKPTAKQRTDTIKNIDKNYQQAMQRYLGESTSAGGQGFGSTGTGVGKGFGGGIVKSPEWFQYKNLVEATIRRGWVWHDTSSSLVATVSFNISETGVVSNVRLVTSSGNTMYDDSILRAVAKASPLPAAPAHIYSDFKFVEMDFRPE